MMAYLVSLMLLPAVVGYVGVSDAQLRGLQA
jgi:hypothetical protein